MLNSKNKPLRIMSLPVDISGCGWLRVRQPLQQIQDYTEHDTHVIDKDKDDMIQILNSLPHADILMLRQGAHEGLPGLKKVLKDAGKEITAKIVYDIDDNIEQIDPYSPHFEGYGTKIPTDPLLKEAFEKDPTLIDFEDNKKRVANFLQGLRESDLTIVTTEKLAQYARTYSPNVVVIPNSIDFTKWFPLPLKPNKDLRVIWSGGHSHYRDWYSIREALNAMLRKYKFTLVLVGTGFTGLIDEDLQKYVEVHPWVPFEAHSYHMMCMRGDIAIIPLADIPFNYYKSSIKYAEMSAMKVPVLASNIMPYNQDIINGENGLLYNDQEDFADKLEDLLQGPLLRERLAENAYRYVREHYDARKNTELYIKAFRALLG